MTVRVGSGTGEGCRGACRSSTDEELCSTDGGGTVVRAGSSTDEGNGGTKEWVGGSTGFDFGGTDEGFLARVGGSESAMRARTCTAEGHHRLSQLQMTYTVTQL